MKMPFGRHAGRELDELPDPYLKWLGRIELQPPLSDAVRREFKRRKTGAALEPRLVSFPAVYVKIPRNDRQLARRLVNAGYSVLAKKLDPAAEGDPDIKQRLDALAETVREQLEDARS
jgi:hypothetical protein